MNCRITMSGNITHSLAYGQNREKGGECFFYNYLDPTESPEKQAKDWEAMSRDYKYKVCQVIISFGDKDTEKFRSMEDTAERVKLERKIIAAFFKELAARGNDVSKTAYAVFHHGNTDNEHFHAYILRTGLDGKRWNDKFIMKNCTRAAAKVSMEFGLEGCSKAMTRELAHQRHTGQIKRTPSNVQSDNGNRKYSRIVDDEGHIHRERGLSADASVMSERLRRQHAVQEAAKRKRQYKYIIWKALDGGKTPENILANTKAAGIRLFLDPKLGISMSATDEEEKEHRYSLQHDLGMDMGLFPESLRPLLTTDYVHETDKRKNEKHDSETVKTHPKVAYGHTMTTKHEAHQHAGYGLGLKGINQAIRQSGGSSSVNREDEVGKHGSSEDDQDEEWKRRNGISY